MSAVFERRTTITKRTDQLEQGDLVVLGYKLGERVVEHVGPSSRLSNAQLLLVRWSPVDGGVDFSTGAAGRKWEVVEP